MDLELDSIYEELVNYHINDYAIFEATLKRDFMEATGLLTEEADVNFLQKIWDTIIALINNVKNKVISLVDSFIIKMNNNKSDKYEKMIEDNRDLLNKTDFSDFTCDFKGIRWSKVDENGKNRFEELCGNFLSQLNWSIEDLRTDDIDKLVKGYKDSIKYNKEIDKNYYNEFIKDFKGCKLAKEWTQPDTLLEIVKRPARDLEVYRKYKLEVLKHFERLQKEVTVIKRKAKKDKNDEELKFAKKAHKALSLVLRDNINSFKLINRLITIEFKGGIKLTSSAISYAKKQNSESSEKSQNASYLFDIDYINALSEAEIYEL